jgi:hypothetical protein
MGKASCRFKCTVNSRLIILIFLDSSSPDRKKQNWDNKTLRCGIIVLIWWRVKVYAIGLIWRRMEVYVTVLIWRRMEVYVTVLSLPVWRTVIQIGKLRFKLFQPPRHKS